MKPFRFSLALVGTGLSMGIASANAQNLKDWKPGETISGETVDFEKLKGRVVAIEYWGPR